MNPSNNIVFYRIPHFPIEDNAKLFNNGVGLIGYPISSDNYILDNQAIKLNLVTSTQPSIPIPRLSSNEAIVFISSSEKNKLKLKLFLSNDLIKKSRFKDNRELQDAIVFVDNNKIIGKELSLKFIFSFFDTYYSPLFPINITKEALKSKVKSISIQRKFGAKPYDATKANEIIQGKLNLRFALFFDGTNNCRYNTKYGYKQIIKELEQRNKKGENLKFEDVLKQFQEGKIQSRFGNFINPRLIEEGSSYLNDYTNIVYLYELYDAPENEAIDLNNEIVYKFYIQGIGPNTKVDLETKDKKYEDDIDIIGKGGGIGNTGVDFRMKEAIEIVIKTIKSILKDNEIGRITFDLFGFSRGSAVARKFHNELFNDTIIQYYVNGFANSYKCKGGYFSESFFQNIARNNIEIFKKIYPTDKIFFRFLGLYDTVDKIKDIKLDISLKKSDTFTCHIIARPDDEYRVNFPLTINDCPNGLDITLYGSHSDIGGGYAVRDYKTTIDQDTLLGGMEKSNKLYLLKEKFDKQYSYQLKDDKLVYAKNQIEIKQISYFKKNQSEFEKKLVLIDIRNSLKNDIQKISLNAIISVAIKNGIKFNKSFSSQEQDYLESEFLTNENLTIKDSKTLSSYNALVKLMIEKSFESSQSIQQEYFLESNYYFDLYNQYIHISSDYNEKKAGLLYINEPEKERLRKINIPE